MWINDKIISISIRLLFWPTFEYNFENQDNNYWIKV